MNNGILTGSTIVPAHLYVERAADRQLRAVIAGMGRPGYILVARQMGKTNLLLNMKREQSDSIVLYLDLSNRFTSARSWFRNVIDRLMELNEDLDSAKGVIEAQRKGDTLEANVEFDRHMRRILKFSEKKIIIILDEIDSLVNTEYSDVILAQVRSMYFSRISYEEYNRLTYVLSGVAEPSDLIKDKNISPFNIGEKIYLYNFDREEFGHFLGKARLDVTDGVAEAIFEWTRGNPRMTWDICAELESNSKPALELSIEDVDVAVHKLYLRDYDRAPVDHIRILATSDSQIRNALVSIRYGKYEFLDAKTKSRLYLAGITNSASESNSEIANKIVDYALSEEWIASINSSTATPKVVASDSYDVGNYSAAIEQYEAALHSLSNSEDFSLPDRISLGMSYLYTGNTTAALRELTYALSRINDDHEVQRVRLFIGVANVTLNNVAQGLQSLKLASNGPVLDLAQHARLESIPALLKLGVAKNGSTALRMSTELIDELSLPTTSDRTDYNSRLVSALYLRAKVYQAQRNGRAACIDIEAALAKSSNDILPILTLCKYELCSDLEEKRNLAGLLFEQIICHAGEIPAGHDLSLNFNKRHLMHALVILDFHGMTAEFERLLIFCSDRIFKGRLTLFSTLISLYSDIGDGDDLVKFCPILAAASRRFVDGAKDTFERIKVHMLLTSRSQGADLIEFGLLYLQDLEATEDLPSDFFDLFHAATFLRLANMLSGKKNSGLAVKLYEQWNRFKSGTLIGPAWTVFMDYQEMVFRRDNQDFEAARVLAQSVVEGTAPDKEEFFQGVEWNAAQNFRKHAVRLLGNKPHGLVPLREQETDRFRHYSRNQKVVVKYKDQSPIEKKFKLVEADLRKGICDFV